jgi:hypothetical protein
MGSWMKNAVLASTLFCGIALLNFPSHAEWQYREIKRAIDPKVEKLAYDFNRGTSKDVVAGVKAIEECCIAYISRFTEPYDRALPNFQAVRRQLDNLLVEGVPRQPPEARQALVSSLVRAAGAIAVKDEYSPAARINCVSLLGDLDDARDSRQNLRKPSASAREKLIEILSLPDSPGYLNAVALQGLERHAWEGASGWDDAAKGKVKQVALSYVTKSFDDGLDYQADIWAARRAFDVLRALRASEGVDQALVYLGDPKQEPKLRMSSLQYLISQDLQSFSDQQKKEYVLSSAHLLRSRLVDWYHAENDRQKRLSGGMGGMGMGGMGMGGMGMGGMGMGGEGGDSGGGDFGGGDFGGLGGMGMGPGGGRGSGGRGGRPIDSQTWETRLARRTLNQLAQYVRVAFDGRRASSESGQMKLYLAKPDLGLAEDYNLTRLIELLDTLQTTVNDTERISTVPTLMTRTKRDIEAIMRFTKNMPGYLEKYSDAGEDDEELQDVEGSDGDESVAPAGDPTGGDGDGQNGGGQNGEGGGGAPGSAE